MNLYRRSGALRAPSSNSLTLFLTAAALLAVPSLFAETAWLQWAGPHGDFTCDAGPLAEKWADIGPKEIWSREIGGGHSTILHEDGVLYTMCRRAGDKDAVLAVKADTGETVWEYQYDAPPQAGMVLDYGVGPHSSPLIAGDRLYTLGGIAHFHCLDKKTGKVLWSHDLAEEFKVSTLLRGYGSSPIAYKDTVIVNIGAGRGVPDPSGLAAFKQDTGEIVWKTQRLSAGYPTPVLVNFDGRDMLVDDLGYDRLGIDPADGSILWQSKVDLSKASIITSALWIPPDMAFFSAGHGGGSQLYRIKPATEGELKYQAEQLWDNNKLRIMHANAIRIDDTIYGCSGDMGPAYLMAVDVKTGKLLWRQRGFSKSTLLLADGKLIILDEDGNLALAKASPEKLEILSKAKILEKFSWTAPTLIGTRLYLRDYKTMKCLDLGVTANQ